MPSSKIYYWVEIEDFFYQVNYEHVEKSCKKVMFTRGRTLKNIQHLILLESWNWIIITTSIVRPLNVVVDIKGPWSQKVGEPLLWSPIMWIKGVIGMIRFLTLALKKGSGRQKPFIMCTRWSRVLWKTLWSFSPLRATDWIMGNVPVNSSAWNRHTHLKN